MRVGALQISLKNKNKEHIIDTYLVLEKKHILRLG